jgi:transcriptional regulator with XRE-family HTH domain
MANQTVKSIGDYIREQREQARISVRQLAQSAGVSNPYLSQIERGLRKPSADILQQIAKGLRISAEALYVQAGILEDRPADTGVRSALLADADLSERQKQVLIEIYESFRKENAAAAQAQAAQAEAGTAQAQAGTAQAEAGTAQAASDAAQAATEAAASEAGATAEAAATVAGATAEAAAARGATKARTRKTNAAAADGRPSRSSWSAATAEAEQDELSGNANAVPGPTSSSD